MRLPLCHRATAILCLRLPTTATRLLYNVSAVPVLRLHTKLPRLRCQFWTRIFYRLFHFVNSDLLLRTPRCRTRARTRTRVADAMCFAAAYRSFIPGWTFDQSTVAHTTAWTRTARDASPRTSSVLVYHTGRAHARLPTVTVATPPRYFRLTLVLFFWFNTVAYNTVVAVPRDALLGAYNRTAYWVAVTRGCWFVCARFRRRACYIFGSPSRLRLPARRLLRTGSGWLYYIPF